MLTLVNSSLTQHCWNRQHPANDDYLVSIARVIMIKVRFPIPDRLIVLTFDDGVKSCATFVAPLLKHYRFGATFYITEGLNFLKDKDRYMTWGEIRELDEAGFEIGNHTRHHKNVSTQLREELIADLGHIDHRCQENGILLPQTFCYPGYHNSPEGHQVRIGHSKILSGQASKPRMEISLY